MVTFKILRYDPETGQKPHYDEFKIDTDKSTTVLEALFIILENHDSSLAFRCSCRAAVCGSCGMKINGHYKLACRTLVSHLNSKTILVEPLAHLPLIKDLVVDMTDLYKKYEVMEPFLIPKEIPPEHKEFCQSPTNRKSLDGLVECILCGSCYAACTMCHWDEDFPGPFAFLAADARLKDDRDIKGRERILQVISESGIWRCHTELQCADVCPKGLKPTEAINHLKRESVKYRLSSPMQKELRDKERAEIEAIPSSLHPLPQLPKPLISRKNFLKAVFFGGAGLLGAAFMGIFTIPLLQKQKRGWTDEWIKIDPVPEIEVGKPIEVIYNRQKWEKGNLVTYPKRSYIVKDENNKMTALDPACTHLGCICYWEESIRMFLCPCHGGAFDIKGNVTLGPPPKPLNKLDVKIKDGMLYLRNQEEV